MSSRLPSSYFISDCYIFDRPYFLSPNDTGYRVPVLVPNISNMKQVFLSDVEKLPKILLPVSSIPT